MQYELSSTDVFTILQALKCAISVAKEGPGGKKLIEGYEYVAKRFGNPEKIQLNELTDNELIMS